MLTKRSLGAPMIAAALFAVHPLAVEPTAWLVGRCDLLATLFGLLAGLLLLRSPGDRRALALAVLAFGVSLFAKATAAARRPTTSQGQPSSVFGRNTIAW